MKKFKVYCNFSGVISTENDFKEAQKKAFNHQCMVIESATEKVLIDYSF